MSTGKTWFIDIDGTIFVHRTPEELLSGVEDEILPDVREFFEQIPSEDTIILCSARPADLKDSTSDTVDKFGLRYDAIIFELPSGARIVINDTKPDGRITAKSIPLNRNEGCSRVTSLLSYL